jgi:hypothetical protein
MRRAGDGHLDPDGLAEFRAGLTTGRRGARISAHLAACERCTALDGELARVSALLSAVQVPAMPDSVARRLDTVLAAEVAKHDFSERAGSEPSGHRDARHRTARTRDFRWIALRVLAPAAAVVVAGAGYGLSQLGGPQPQFSSASSGSAPSAASSVQAAPAARGVSASATAAASARGPVLAAPARPQRRSPVEIAVVISRTNFLPGTMKQQVEADMRRPVALRPTVAASTAVRACVLHLAGGDPIVLAETARFEGRPATVAVVRTSHGDLALVAGSACSATNRDVQASTTVPAGISGP